MWFVPLVGPTAYFRFDLVPAVLAGGAVLALMRRPALCGTLTAIGAALKLWPAIMLPIFLLGRTNRRRVLGGFLATGGALALASLLAGGVERLMSPLQWQANRGLQIESLPAGPLMLVRMFDPKGPWDAPLSLYKARELTGPGVSAFLTASTILMIAGIALLVVLWNRARLAPTVTVEIVGWLLVATAAVATITNKVLSPQYILWLGGPLAALAVRQMGDHHVRVAMRLLLVIALLTQVNYPLLYPWLVNGNFPVQFGTLVLETRNVLLVVFAWQALNGYGSSPSAPSPDCRQHPMTATASRQPSVAAAAARRRMVNAWPVWLLTAGDVCHLHPVRPRTPPPVQHRGLRPGDLRSSRAPLRAFPSADRPAERHVLQHLGRPLPPDHRDRSPRCTGSGVTRRRC